MIAIAITLDDNNEINTNHIYGFYDIYKDKDRLRAKGLQMSENMQDIYLINHTRTTLDLLHRSLTRWSRVVNLTGASTDWLDSYDQGAFLLEQTALLAP